MGALEDLAKQIKETEERAKRAEEENERLREELNIVKDVNSIKYMFPAKEIISFEEIADMTGDNPMHFKKHFVEEPDAVIRQYLRDFFAEAVNIGNSLKLLGIKADGTTYQNSVRYLVGYAKKYPKIVQTEEFAKAYSLMIPELIKYIEMEDKLTSSRMHIVRRSIGTMSMIAYWLHMKSIKKENPTYDPMIIHPKVAERLEEPVGDEVVDEEPLEEKADDTHEEFSEMLKDEPKDKGIVEKIKDALINKPIENVPPEEEETEETDEEGDEEEEEPEEK